MHSKFQAARFNDFGVMEKTPTHTFIMIDSQGKIACIKTSSCGQGQVRTFDNKAQWKHFTLKKLTIHDLSGWCTTSHGGDMRCRAWKRERLFFMGGWPGW